MCSIKRVSFFQANIASNKSWAQSTLYRMGKSVQNISRSHYPWGILKTKQSTVMLDLWLRKTRSGRPHDRHAAIVFEYYVLMMFSVHTKTKSLAAFSNSSDHWSVFRTLRFRDGLVWTVCLIVQKPASFSNCCGVMWQLLYVQIVVFVEAFVCNKASRILSLNSRVFNKYVQKLFTLLSLFSEDVFTLGTGFRLN